jgi:starch phosphorylase
MKVAANGGLNLSVLDGWWVEGYKGDNGWAIGAGEEYTDLVYQDDIESRAIYDLLEQEIVPLFYSRTSDGLPRGWIRMMKRSMSTVTPVFNTHRMVQEYMEKCYSPSALRYRHLAGENMVHAAALAKWRKDVRRSWPGIRVEKVESNGAESLYVGEHVKVAARVNLGGLRPQDVEVQLFHGVVDSLGQIPNPSTIEMSSNGAHEGNSWVFSGTIPCRASGQHGFAVRVLPRHDDQANPFETGLICWG